MDISDLVMAVERQSNLLEDVVRLLGNIEDKLSDIRFDLENSNNTLSELNSDVGFKLGSIESQLTTIDITLSGIDSTVSTLG
ncbi:hypothetical protein [Deinococcus soli (ex Cha et al. 2016)]|uniref:Uncharacterized protein n=2 Tax=Deinococcus soli (ex Cha et al. 2016) TaxID=1309411 RepID=A0AAE3XF69_9DEIO|nr:hypothetical protein [Deinococcus soli (ex Cha et al. 2016)]MDR6219839.1 hypothetical protein [Deinococcus soli (ex Cha et al. 2016)]MDR6329903.1 hypothetical protein [Deinococcus soli (ex Cha et al. 2016)]MDR6752746.1 hypothetical protein [Deinococcus soli (ex Cha et al. 2016)]